MGDINFVPCRFLYSAGQPPGTSPWWPPLRMVDVHPSLISFPSSIPVAQEATALVWNVVPVSLYGGSLQFHEEAFPGTP